MNTRPENRPAEDRAAASPAPAPVKGALELTAESLRRDIARLAIPLMAESLLGLTIFLADGIMVSRLGTLEMASVGLATHVAWMISFVPMGLGIGCAAMVARAVGQRDPKEAAQVFVHALVAAVGFGLVAATTVTWLGEPILRLMQAEPDVAAEGAVYLRWVALGLLGRVVVRVAGSAFKAAGEPRIPLLISVGTVGLNIVGNYMLIYGNWGAPRMEVRGAALATLIASMTGTVLFLLAIARPGATLHARASDLFRLRRRIYTRLARVSLPALGEIGLNQLGWIIHTVLITRLGTEALAVHSIALRTESLSFIPAFAFATVAGTLVGQHLGRGNPELARRALGGSWRSALALMGTMGLLFLVAPGRLVALFGPEPSVAVLAAACVRASAFEQPGFAITMTFNGALRGAGDTVSPLVVTIAGTLLLRPVLVLALAYGLGWGIVGVWIATVADWTLRAVVAVALFRRGRWMHVRV